MATFGRRTFLKSSLLGTGGALLSAPAIAAGSFNRNSSGIITRKLGATGLDMPVISMGVMRADNPSLIRASLDAGIIHFDTAHGYQNGRNEEMVGEVLKDVPRDKIIVATKVSPADKSRETGELGPGATKEDFLTKFETSLKRLQMDHVDILYQHGAGSAQAVHFEPMLDALTTAKKEGKARFIGYSTHSNEPEVIRAAMETGVIDVVLVAYNFKQDHNEEIRAAIAEAAAKGMGFIGMKSMAGGFLDKEKQKPINGKAALKWILQDPNLTTCIPGYTSFDHINQAVEVLTDLTLTPEELSDIEMARTEAGLYCNQCGECIPQCPLGLPIPGIMRSYMYAYGYGEMKKARETLDVHNVQDNPCSGCTECSVVCTKGFHIADRIADVSRLKNVPSDFLT